MNHDLSQCILCGITQIESVILKLKNIRTFISCNNVFESESQQSININEDEIQQRMKSLGSIHVSCPNRNDNKICPSTLRLAKYLIHYNDWSKKTNDAAYVDNVEVKDIATHIKDDNIYQNIIKESANSIPKINSELVCNMLQDDGFWNLGKFLKFGRKQFSIWLPKYTNKNIKRASACKLYDKTISKLRVKTQQLKFGKFISEIDSKIINEDYHHILHSHIFNGSKLDKENIFRFYEKIVHYEDSNPSECSSLKRRDQRTIWLDSKVDDDKKEQQSKHDHDKNMYSLKQYYMKSKLDTIHSYLAHSNWFNRKYQKDMDEKKEKLNESYNMHEEIVKQKKSSHVTDISKNDVMQYRFGIEHQHPHLTPIYECVKDELLKNKLYKLSANEFDHLLFDAIKTHGIALNEYKELTCKYYHVHYNIIRNKSIGIRHILSIIIYTDVSKFCTKFRESYRKIDTETEDYQVVKRHRELYFYARSLFESVEFYGTQMDRDMVVYHGLNRRLIFSEFTAYINQPISTTKSIKTAQQFSEGAGVILSLKSGSEYSNEAKAPKFLNVSWISVFPNEEEKLFYGMNCVFQIHNIIEATTMTEHEKELKMLNKFQKTVKGQDTQWDDTEIINSLVILIKQQLKLCPNDTEKQDSKKLYISQLFDHFVQNKDLTSSIWIKHYQELPIELQHVLFNKINIKDPISLIPISQLFKYLNEITLNDLAIDRLEINSHEYIKAVKQHLQNNKNNNLKKIIFQSKGQQNRKVSMKLKSLAAEENNIFNELKWTIEYELDGNMKHNLRFINNNNEEIEISQKPSSNDENKPTIEHDKQNDYDSKSEQDDMNIEYKVPDSDAALDTDISLETDDEDENIIESSNAIETDSVNENKVRDDDIVFQSLETQNEELKKQIQALQNKSNSQLQQSRQQFDNLKTEDEKAQKTVKELEQKYEQLLSKHNDAEVSQNEHKAKIEQLNKSFKIKINEIEVVKQDNSKLKAQLLNIMNSNSTETKKLQTEINTITQQYENERIDSKSQKQEIEKWMKFNHKQQNEIIELNNKYTLEKQKTQLEYQVKIKEFEELKKSLLDKSTIHIRASWKINDFCLIYSRSKSNWVQGQIVKIQDSESPENEWMIVKYGLNNKQRKKIQRYCLHIQPIPNNHAVFFNRGSKCKIYSNTIGKWCDGKVEEIYIDEKGEWLKVIYKEGNNMKICDIQRYSNEIKLIVQNI